MKGNNDGSTRAKSSGVGATTVNELFANQLTRSPNDVAIDAFGHQLTFAELNSRANQLANFLIDWGVEPDVPVAVCLDRSVEMLVAVLAILKAGGAYVPIDPGYPEKRFAYILSDSSTPIVVTQEKHAKRCSEAGKRILRLDTDWPQIDQQPNSQTAPALHSENLAYVLYTSGSTGEPKGVAMPHGPLVNLLEWQINDWTCPVPCRVLQFASLNFDVSFQEIFSTWCSGGTIVLIDDPRRKDPAALCQFLIEQEIGRSFLPYIALKHLAEFSVRERLFPVSLHDVITAGEQLQITPEITEFFKQLPKASLQNQYGPTETHVVTAFRLPRNHSHWTALPPIGTPIQNTHILLLDDQLNRVQDGEVGEIYIGGVCLARGYHRKPSLSEERFVSNGIDGSPSLPRLYKTGDLGRFLPDGNIEFTGRSDDQVKIRGYRIELGEIEVALRRHPDVADAAVLARTRYGVKQLAAYVVPNSDTALSQQTLRLFLEEWLPAYSIPAAISFLPLLPMSPNGKVDRSALLNTTHEPISHHGSLSEATNMKEHALLKIWTEVMDCPSISIHDNFFELGGDSILAIQVCAKAQACGLECSMEQLYANPTIAALAALCRDANPSSPEVLKPFALVPEYDRNRQAQHLLDDAYPMTRLQSGMAYHSGINEHRLLYLEVFTYRLFIPFDELVLRTAITCLLNRHPVLRTSFDLAAISGPTQLVHSATEPLLHIEDLRELPAADQALAVDDATKAERQQTFSLQTAPLLRFRVQLLDQKSLHLILSFHHAILDGWSLATFMAELLHNYMKMLGQTSIRTPALQFTFRDYVALEKATLSSVECRDFWRRHLAGAEFSPVALPSPGSSSRTPYRCESVDVELSDDLRLGLLKVASEAQVPLKTVLHAAHQYVVSFLIGHPDVVSGYLVDCRPEMIDADKCLGLFVNTVPMRLHIMPGNWMDLISHVAKVEGEILPFRRYPLSQIQHQNGKATLFDNAFNFVHFHAWKRLEQFGECEVVQGPYYESTNFALLATFTLDPEGNRLTLRLDYHRDKFTAERIAAISGYYTRCLEEIVQSHRSEHHKFSPLSPQEKQRLLVERNTTAKPYPNKKCIHTLFEEQAQRSPNAIAVRFTESHLTYEQLNHQANQLAHRLRDIGVNEQSLVGICVNRSIQMVVGLLAILKAGAANVPLDPSYPSDRLAFMAEDANLGSIVTETRLARLFPTTNHLIFIDETHNVPGGSKDLGATLSSDNLAYVIYTSGSTGRPKGVPIRHSSVVNVLNSVATLTGFKPHDVILGLTTISFDISVLEIFLPLITGAQLILVPRDTASDGMLLAELAKTSGATVIQGTPATWKMLVRSGWTGHKRLKVFCGGEALQRELADELLSRSEAVWNLYGPTETTIYSTAWQVIPEHPISIGRPVANTQLYILDSNMQPVPEGVVGELYIGGDGLANGYLNRPDMTREKFVRNPFLPEQDACIYRTGDLARYLPDGNVFLLGRIDHQVKIRGHRIELGEIETRILEHDAVKEVVAAPYQDGTGENSLAAYIVLHSGSSLPVAELREFLKPRLPAFMVPSAFVFLESLPLTPSGKVDRRALPSPQTAPSSRREPDAPPRTPIEQALADIWAQVLRVDKIGVNDNFIELGGHSLSALQVAARIKHKFNVTVPIATILQSATIAQVGESLFTTLMQRAKDEDADQEFLPHDEPGIPLALH